MENTHFPWQQKSHDFSLAFLFLRDFFLTVFEFSLIQIHRICTVCLVMLTDNIQLINDKE